MKQNRFIFCALNLCAATWLTCLTGQGSIAFAQTGAGRETTLSVVTPAIQPTSTTGDANRAAAKSSSFELLRDADIVLFRHANAPGFGDPPGFKLDDCASQRNLDAVGREQAKALGQAIKATGVQVAVVWTSQWCRARETAQLLNLSVVRDMAGCLFE